MKPLLLLLLSVLASIPALASPATPDSEPGGFAEWKLVTKQNFSSQIRHHPHSLLLVTLPWSGESRSLMKEIAHSLHKRKEEFGSLRLMFMYKNVEKMLADAIGASQETAIMYYHHSTSYKYRGRLRAQNILSSLHPYLTVPPENLPLELINFEQDLKSFLESTDRALLLLEFCGWAPELLSRGRKNGTEHSFGSQGDIVQVHDKMDRMSTFIGNKKQKSLENGVAQCGIQNGFYGITSFGELSSVNDSSTVDSTEDERHGAGVSCNFREFQQFESFFSKFMTAAREFLLPPERHRFGLITNRSLLLSLEVGEIDSWSAMIHYAGCPSCSKYLEKEEDFERFLQMEDPAVAELEDNERNIEPALPANRPSILLFVDRSSDSSETRIKSKEALDAFRELALRYHIPAHMSEENKEELGKFSAHSHLSSRSMHRHPKASGSTSHPKLKLYQSAQSVKLGDRVSFMLVNEEKHVTLDKIATDVQVSSLHEVLENLLQKNKAAKLSSLAKKAGFQLLSDDFEIKIANPLLSQTEIQPNQASVEISKEDLVSQIDRDQEKVMDIMSTSAAGLGENINPTGSEPLHDDEEKRDTASLNDDLTSAESEQPFTNTELDNLEDIRVDKIHLSKVDESREQLQPRGLEGSFFFLDGNFRLLKALTGGLKVPSLVIIDPILQCHYLFSDQTNFSYTPLAIFLNGYLNGSLLPYQQSESLILMPREAAQPPFVNLDFHEADFIPRIAAKTFYELVFGFNHSEIGNVAPARRKDMLVLFSNGWCGFCQRMEIVVREVHRALRGYMNMLSCGFQNAQAQFSSGSASYVEDNTEDMAQKLPLVYLMDCTMNDCSLIFKAMNQRELYPALVLFPAENKTSVSYDGDMAVASIVEFLADHGSHSHNLIEEKGILWTPPAKHDMGQKSFSTTSNVAHEESLTGKDQLQDFLLQNKATDRTVKYSWTELPKSNDPDGAASRVVVGSILVATEKLLGMHPFDNSLILIVKANQITGFQGLIINKPISWDFLHELEEWSEFLKEAPLSLGGPLVNRGLPLVSFTRVDKNQYLEILPGMRFIDQLETVREINELRAGNGSVTDYWFFLGYASWGWDQLFDEIDKGAWNIKEDAMKEFTWPRP
ncbi:uncharacterized protein LOC115738296 isoform X2 [Rhodamnia argentea]|uniref:Uncharacterized protein LOC115738296 isoform X2 n=1 Tax=Rhodamnia argentea TaxID=178133 RepID=A0A8B8NW31_9MYRT|nr:uncharacterized protein LOC115738296 isoform X2 [Rhodamnia argentea]